LVQSLQQSFSQVQSGQPSQQAFSLQHPCLALAQPDLGAGAVVDDDVATVPATSAPSNTKASDSFVIIIELASGKDEVRTTSLTD
jgi:hypothetical protein